MITRKLASQATNNFVQDVYRDRQCQWPEGNGQDKYQRNVEPNSTPVIAWANTIITGALRMGRDRKPKNKHHVNGSEYYQYKQN